MKIFKWLSKFTRATKIQKFLWPEYFKSAGGEIVNEETALNIDTVWRCIWLLSDTISTLPLHLYRKLDDDNRERVTDHPAYLKLRYKANQYQSRVTFLSQMQAQLALHGAAYAQKIYNRGNELKELVPLSNHIVKPIKTEDQGIEFEIHYPSGKMDTRGPEDILYIPAFVMNGVEGISPLDAARKNFGRALAQQRYATNYYQNGGAPSIILEHPGVMGEEAQQTFKKSLDETYTGASNAGKPWILEEGMKVNSISFSPEQSQFLETEKLSVPQICRWWGIQPHMVGHLEDATYSNIEQQSLEFVTFTLRPWLVKWETELNCQLLSQEESEEEGLYFEFKVDALLRGDMFTRNQAFKIAIDGGWLNRDEVRAMENRPPIPDGLGKVFNLTLPGATDVNKPRPEPEDEEEPDEEPTDDENTDDEERVFPDEVLKAWSETVKEMVGRVVRKDFRARKKAEETGKLDAHFKSWSQKYYGDFKLNVSSALRGLCDQLEMKDVPTQALFHAIWQSYAPAAVRAENESYSKLTFLVHTEKILRRLWEGSYSLEEHLIDGENQ